MPELLVFGTRLFRIKINLATLFFAILVTCFLLYKLSMTRELLAEQATVRLQESATQSSASMELWVNSQRDHVANIAQNPVLVTEVARLADRLGIDPVPEAHDSAWLPITQHLEQSRKIGEIFQLRIVNKTGLTLQTISSNKRTLALFTSNSNKIRPYTQRAISGETVFIPPVNEINATNLNIFSHTNPFAFVSRVGTAEGDYSVLLEWYIEPNSAFSRIGAKASNDGTADIRTVAYNQERQIISPALSGPTILPAQSDVFPQNHRYAADAASTVFGNSVGILSARTSGQSQTPYPNNYGNRVYGAWQWLPELELGIYSQMDYDVAMAPAHAHVVITAVILALVYLAGIARSFLFVKASNSYERQMTDIYTELEEKVDTRTRELRQKETQLTVALDEAEKATKAKSAFLANMSHEIRTPMNTIIGFSDILSQCKLSQTQSGYVHNISDSARSLLNLLNDILDVAKLNSDGFKLVEEEFNIIYLMEKVTENFSLQASSKNVELELSVHPTVPTVVNGDEHRLRQVLVNLISNAVKFTDIGSVKLECLSSNKKDYLRFKVSDTGCGIAEDAIDRLFQPFVQIDESHARSHQGTGLGTAIAREIVEQMGGKISVDSILHQGTTFEFDVRLPAVTTNTYREKNMVTNTIEMRPLKLLVVEDIEANIKLNEIRLGQLGHSITVARNGQQAINAYKNNPDHFDVILMDIHMPIMDGFEATTRIRAYEKSAAVTSATPIIAVSASATAEDRSNSKAIGINEFCSKPVNYDQLVELLAKCVPQAVIDNEHDDYRPITPAEPDFGLSDNLDVIKALTLWKDMDEYVHALNLSRFEFEGALSRIDRFIAAEQLGEALTICKAIRSTAGNLYAVRLKKTADSLCNALENRSGEYCQKSELLQRAMDDFVSAISMLKEENIEVNSHKYNNQLDYLLNRLTSALNCGDKALIHVQLDMLSRYCDAISVRRIRDCVDTSSIGEAKSVVTSLRDNLGNTG